MTARAELFPGPRVGLSLAHPLTARGVVVAADVQHALLNDSSGSEDARDIARHQAVDRFCANLLAQGHLGRKVLVPLHQDPVTSAETIQDTTANDQSAQTVFPININTASKETLMQLPGIGEVKAQAIIDFRNQNGPFTSLDQIQEVNGIGPATFEKLKDLITIF